VWDLLRLIPVCPKSWGLHSWQAPLLAAVRPGQWVQRCCGLRTNWKRQRWVVRNATLGDVVLALSKCEHLTEQRTHREVQFKAADYHVHDCTATSFCAFFFTTYRQWLDVIEVSQVPSAAGAGKNAPLELSAYSFSASVVPASSPLALITAILLFWIPFSDIGQNELHLRTLCALLEENGIQVELRG